MFLYVHWAKDINIPQQWQAFTEDSKAIEYVMKQISRYCSYEVAYCKDNKYTEFPVELVKLQNTLRDKTILPSVEGAMNLIKLYEEYMLYGRGIETPLHILKYIQTVE
jgi:hypothetical protein